VRSGSGWVALTGPGMTEGVDESALTANALWEAVTGKPSEGWVRAGTGNPLRSTCCWRRRGRLRGSTGGTPCATAGRVPHGMGGSDADTGLGRSLDRHLDLCSGRRRRLKLPGVLGDGSRASCGTALHPCLPQGALFPQHLFLLPVPSCLRDHGPLPTDPFGDRSVGGGLDRLARGESGPARRSRLAIANPSPSSTGDDATMTDMPCIGSITPAAGLPGHRVHRAVTALIGRK
jgi:hypothetical protein